MGAQGMAFWGAGHIPFLFSGCCYTDMTFLDSSLSCVLHTCFCMFVMLWLKYKNNIHHPSPAPQRTSPPTHALYFLLEFTGSRVTWLNAHISIKMKTVVLYCVWLGEHEFHCFQKRAAICICFLVSLRIEQNSLIGVLCAIHIKSLITIHISSRENVLKGNSAYYFHLMCTLSCLFCTWI